MQDTDVFPKFYKLCAQYQSVIATTILAWMRMVVTFFISYVSWDPVSSALQSILLTVLLHPSNSWLSWVRFSWMSCCSSLLFWKVLPVQSGGLELLFNTSPRSLYSLSGPFDWGCHWKTRSQHCTSTLLSLAEQTYQLEEHYIHHSDFQHGDLIQFSFLWKCS